LATTQIRQPLGEITTAHCVKIVSGFLCIASSKKIIQVTVRENTRQSEYRA